MTHRCLTNFMGLKILCMVCLFSIDGIRVDAQPVSNQKPNIILLMADVLPIGKREELCRGSSYKTLYTTNLIERQRHYNNDRGEKDNKLKYIGDHHCPQPSNSRVDHHDQSKQNDCPLNREACGYIDQLGHGIEESPGVKYRKEQEDIGVKLLGIFT